MRRVRTGFLIAALTLASAGPAFGQQVDLTGMWSASLGNHEELPLRGDPGVEVGEYVGIPLNEAARQHAESWMPTMHSLLEWQGRPLTSLDLAARGLVTAEVHPFGLDDAPRAYELLRGGAIDGRAVVVPFSEYRP